MQGFVPAEGFALLVLFVLSSGVVASSSDCCPATRGLVCNGSCCESEPGEPQGGGYFSVRRSAARWVDWVDIGQGKSAHCRESITAVLGALSGPSLPNGTEDPSAQSAAPTASGPYADCLTSCTAPPKAYQSWRRCAVAPTCSSGCCESQPGSFQVRVAHAHERAK